MRLSGKFGDTRISVSKNVNAVSKWLSGISVCKKCSKTVILAGCRGNGDKVALEVDFHQT